MIIVPPLDPLPNFQLITCQENANIIIPPRPIKRRRGKRMSQQDLQLRIDIINDIINKQVSKKDRDYYDNLKSLYESMINDQNFIIAPQQNTEIPRFVNEVFQQQQINNVYNLTNSMNYHSMITTLDDLYKMIRILQIFRDFERPLYMNSISVEDKHIQEMNMYYEQLYNYSYID